MAHQIAHPTARTSGIPGPSELNYVPGTPGYFTKGDPVTETPATVVTMDWLNMIQEEIKNVVEISGQSLATALNPDNTQFSQAVPVLSRWNLPVETEINAQNVNTQGEYDASQDHGQVLPCDAQNGDLKILLPSATLAENGFTLAIVKIDQSAQIVSVVPAGSDKLQGTNLSFNLVSQNQFVVLVSNGIDGWQVIANQQANVDVTALRTDIDLNAAKIAGLKSASLKLRDGISLDLMDMDDAETGSQNVQIKDGVAINHGDFGPYHLTEFSGTDEVFTVPQHVTSIRVKMWGASGGGGTGGGIGTRAYGGGGGYAYGEIKTVAGEQFLLSVGGGGGLAPGSGSFSGGGYTALYRGDTKLSEDVLLVAGGGGGVHSPGGAGGGLVGQNAGWASGGRGGTQTAGGAGGSGTYSRGSNGSSFLGGNGYPQTAAVGGGYNGGGNSQGNAHGGGGGAGGGYYGGGGGGTGAGTSARDDAGGGGGSGYVHPSVMNASSITGSGPMPGNAADADRPTDVGQAVGGVGSPGAILLSQLGLGADMDWRTPVQQADTAIQKHRIQFLLSAENTVLNSNFIVSVSSDNGTHWDQLTAEQIGTISDGRQIIVAEGDDTLGGTNVQARVTSHSGAIISISDFTHRWMN